MNGYLQVFQLPCYQTSKSTQKMPNSVVGLTVKSLIDAYTRVKISRRYTRKNLTQVHVKISRRYMLKSHVGTHHCSLQNWIAHSLCTAVNILKSLAAINWYPRSSALCGFRTSFQSHTKSNLDDHTAKLNQGGRKITRVYRRSRKSRKTIVRCQFTINTGKKKENTSKYSPKLSTTHYKALIRHMFYYQKYIKSFTLGLLADFLGRLRML